MTKSSSRTDGLRNHEMSDKFPQTLYHYCSLSTFLSIVKNKSIWVSDIERSNDFMELISLRQLLSKYINADLNEIIESNMMSGDKEKASQLWNLRDNFNDMLHKRVAKTFAFCLSEEKDLLSQWRGYADDGKGVAVGFKSEYIKGIERFTFEVSRLPSMAFSFDKVEYRQSKARSFIRKQIKDFGFKSCKSVEEYQSALYYITTRTASRAPFFKTEAFCEEKEWRLVLLCFIKALSKNNFSEFSNSEIKMKDIDYIVSHNELVPHVEIEFSDIANAISEIVIGPKCKETEADIKNFLVFMGALKDINDNSIKISKSKASYR